MKISVTASSPVGVVVVGAVVVVVEPPPPPAGAGAQAITVSARAQTNAHHRCAVGPVDRRGPVPAAAAAVGSIDAIPPR